MNNFAALVLLVWLPVVVIVFNALPPRKAVARLFVAAWMFLPDAGFAIPALPDYTKSSATVIGVLMAAAMFDLGTLLALKFRWFDIPVIVWVGGAFVTALANGLTVYDGLAAMLNEAVSWGLPYLVGRAYMNSVDALKELAEAIAIGGIVYIPLCLLEVRMSPILSSTVYGTGNWEGFRYGGFRPRVFFSNGLALSLWMMNTTLMCCVLSMSGTFKSIRGIPFKYVTLALVVTIVLCKSTGAIILLMMAFVAYFLTRRMKKTLVLWLLLAISPVYCIVRTFDLWSGQQVADFAKTNLDQERGESFEYRMRMERQLADRALERPILGWGQYNRFQVTNPDGKTVTVPDGYWIIAFGTQGLIGLLSILLLFLMPMGMTLRRFPVSTWKDPRIGPVVALSLVLTISMIDCLSNAMVTPVFPLMVGGLVGLAPYRPGGEHLGAEEALAYGSHFATEGKMVEAGREFHRAIGLTSTADHDDAGARRIQAEAFDGLGHSLQAAGHHVESIEAFGEALALRDELAEAFPDDDHFRDLAIARDGLSRALAEAGRLAEAIAEREHALQIWDILAANNPKDHEYLEHRVNTLNDLAWIMATDPGPVPPDPARALVLAEEAIRLSPHHDASWNTLGVARYRAGDHAGAIEALERSALAAPNGQGTAFDHYFLAMAWCRLRREDLAGEWLERGVAWAARHRPGHPTLERFRREAEALLEPERTA